MVKKKKKQAKKIVKKSRAKAAKKRSKPKRAVAKKAKAKRKRKPSRRPLAKSTAKKRPVRTSKAREDQGVVPQVGESPDRNIVSSPANPPPVNPLPANSPMTAPPIPPSAATAETTPPAPAAAPPTTQADTPPVAPANIPLEAPSTTMPEGVTFHALLIACDFYLPNRLPGGTYPNLSGCVRDVTHIEQFLRRRAGLRDANLIVLTSTDVGGTAPKEAPADWPTYENIIAAFRKITSEAATGDQVYIHYSGHGGRTPTIAPRLKGVNGLDETLVPMDIGNQTARYLRDLELEKLLKNMVDKGLIVTVVLDCCHSGGAARGAFRGIADRPDTNIGVRGVDFIDTVDRPASAVLDLEDDAFDRSVMVAGARREGVSRSIVVSTESLGYTLLAACRPSESAYEFAFEGNERNGALTYWFLNALQTSSELTYRMLYDRILARIHSQFSLQTPLLQGDPDRLVLGIASRKADFAITVMSVERDTVRLAAGQANLVRAGAEFAIYPNGTLDFKNPQLRTAIVRISRVGAADAVGEITQRLGTGNVQPGDAAVLIRSPAQQLTQRVRVTGIDGGELKPDDTTLQSIVTALASAGWPEVQPRADLPADIIIRLSPDGSEILICDPDGRPLSLRPAVKSNDPNAISLIVNRLEHLAKFRAVLNLENGDRTSPLAGKLVARLIPGPVAEDGSRQISPRSFSVEQPAMVAVNQEATLIVENNSDVVLNVAVLDLQSDWGITYAFPRETDLAFEPIDPHTQRKITLCFDLGPDTAQGTDRLKVFGTIEPTSFHDLELPPLDQPPAPPTRGPTFRGGANRDLKTIMDAFASNQPKSRNLLPYTPSAASGWTVAQVDVTICTKLDESRTTPIITAESQYIAAPSEPAAPVKPSAGLPINVAFETFRARQLSIWQSSVEEVVAEQIAQQAPSRGPGEPAPDVASAEVRGSSPALAATALAAALNSNQPLNDAQPVLPGDRGLDQEADRGVVGTAWKCSKLGLELAWAKANGDAQAVQTLSDELSFSGCDPLWASAVERYVSYFVRLKGQIPYRSGGNYILDFTLPAKATIALIGDWGTGTEASAALLRQVAAKRPDLVLHLGDIYYSGTKAEVQARFLKISREILENTPLFSLSGNHDMYSGGEGYYWLVDQLGQRASHFCIRNAHWQFLAMDTGYNDFNPFTVNSNVTCLTDYEATWHRTRIHEARAAGLRTVLLSHHQLFSAFEAIGGDSVNRLLLSQFQDQLDNVAAWFWGHEHRLGLYAPFSGLERGRCLGCSAIPVFVSPENDTPSFPPPLLTDASGKQVMLDEAGSIYDHAFAIMELDGPTAKVSYFEQSRETPLFSESIT